MDIRAGRGTGTQKSCGVTDGFGYFCEIQGKPSVNTENVIVSSSFYESRDCGQLEISSKGANMQCFSIECEFKHEL